MKNSAIGVPVIVLCLLLSGCLASGGDRIKGEDYLLGVPLEGSDEGSGYLGEKESEVVFQLKIGEGQYLIRLSDLINWKDEDPVDEGVRYVNEGDQFSAVITNGDNVNICSNSINMEDCEGRLYLYLDGDIVDNQTLSLPGTYSVIVTLLYAGDQYPYYYRSEVLKVEDTGNDYRWSVDYTYVDRNL